MCSVDDRPMNDEGELMVTGLDGSWKGLGLRHKPSDLRLSTETPEDTQGDIARGHLYLQKATFKDSEGNKVVIKRSKCRHYYIKVQGQGQQRVSLDEARKAVSF